MVYQPQCAKNHPDWTYLDPPPKTAKNTVNADRSLLGLPDQLLPPKLVPVEFYVILRSFWALMVHRSPRHHGVMKNNAPKLFYVAWSREAQVNSKFTSGWLQNTSIGCQLLLQVATTKVLNVPLCSIKPPGPHQCNTRTTQQQTPRSELPPICSYVKLHIKEPKKTSFRRIVPKKNMCGIRF